MLTEMDAFIMGYDSVADAEAALAIPPEERAPRLTVEEQAQIIATAVTEAEAARQQRAALDDETAADGS